MNLKSIILSATLLSSIAYSDEKPSMVFEVPVGPALTLGEDSFTGLYGNIGLESYFQGEQHLWGGGVKASGELSLTSSNGSNTWIGAAALLKQQRLRKYYTLGFTFGLGAYSAKIIQNPESCPLLGGMNFGGDSYDYCTQSDLPTPIYESQIGVWVPLKVQAGLRYKILSIGLQAENSYLLSLTEIGNMSAQLGLGVYASLIF